VNYTPNEIQNMVFHKRFIGYHQNQVEDIMNKVVDDYSTYIRENIRLKDKISKHRANVAE
jgi:cell division initiation protein